MKRVYFVFLSLVLAVAAMLVAAASPALATGDSKVAASPRLGTSVAVHKRADTPGAYECTILVTDLATGSEIAAPTIIAKYGQAAEVVNSMSGGEILRAKVTVDSNGAVAEYSVSLARGSEILTEHKGKVSLSL
jgi:hypothetical protein